VRRLLRAIYLATAAFTAAVVFYVLFTLPPAAQTLAPEPPPTVVPGGYHIHTTRSDGSGTVDEIAAAAARAGLKFIVLTDHGDATRAPDPPAYRHGVLCLDAVEISTFGGHVVAMNLGAAAPYPLAGETADVIEDIHRLGGWAIAAHPDSPKPNLRWTAGNAPYDAIEWLNADSEWRDNRVGELAGTLGRSFVRPAEAIVSLFDRPARTLQRWDAAMVSRPVVSLAAVDAHAHGLIGWSDAEETQGRTLFTRPTYEHLFRALAQAVVLDQPLSGDAAPDAKHILAALAAGHSFSIVRGLAAPAALEFSAQQNGVEIPMGARTLVVGAPGTIRANVPQAASARVELIHNNRLLVKGQGSATYSGVIGEGGYRVEVFFGEAAVPWIVSNPIYAGLDVLPVTGEPPLTTPTVNIPQPGKGWEVEHDQPSTGTWAIDQHAIRFDYRLGGGPPAGQFAALTAGIAGNIGVDRIEFVAHANPPARISVQVRLPGGPGGNRWRRSVYLDETPRNFSLRLRDFDLVERTTTLRPNVARVQTVLFVIDTLNTPPGRAGSVWIFDAKVGVGGQEQGPQGP
jgi:hypothetical protein